MSGGVDWDEAVAAYLADVPLREIAARHGVSHVTIMRHMDKLGIKRGRKKKAARPGNKKRTKSTKSAAPVTGCVEPELHSGLMRRGGNYDRSESLENLILEAIADGQSTTAACAQAGVSRTALYHWMQADRDLVDKYARAKDLAADLYAEQIIEIADDTSRDWIVNTKGEKVVDREAVQRSGLRMDARKWYAARVAPRKYGDRPGTDANLGGQGAGRVIEVVFIEPDGRVASAQNSGSEKNVHSIRGD